ncbi:MAG: class I mannose-6-phosphate isomerase, partial [Bacteroidales bacterium]|nr:class I mannose-6-phosphate isomerase [Bacteroidales bacterium]
AIIYSGFREPVTRDIYLEALREGKIVSLLNAESCAPGDVFFIPAGRIHATGAGTLLAEIQQTSDITYRIYDWDRTSSSGPARELHNDLALGAIDFSYYGRSVIRKPALLNKTETLVGCEYFNTNILQFDRAVEKDYSRLDSFVVYLCTEGKFSIRWNAGEEKAVKGETLLIPASIKELALIPEERSTLLEIYIDTGQNL